MRSAITRCRLLGAAALAASWIGCSPAPATDAGTDAEDAVAVDSVGSADMVDAPSPGDATDSSTVDASDAATDGATTPSRWVTGYYVGYQRSLYPPESV